MIPLWRYAGKFYARGMDAKSGPVPVQASLQFKLVPIDERISPGHLFPKAQPLEVELGAGDGSFLARYATLHPSRNYIGVERLLGRLRKIDRKGRRAGLTNLRLARIEASYFLEFLLPPDSVRALHVYFPDPWPKRKHKKNRLINARFPQLARAVLEETGTVYLRTDHEEYFNQMQESFAADTRFVPVETPGSLQEVETDFERNFLLRNVKTLRAAYQLRPGAA